MGLFSKEFSNVIEWEEYREDIIFYKWHNKEVKKGSRLIIRPGQDAIVLHNGAIEGIFKDEGNFQIESEIIPFLSTLKGFKFGFNSGIRLEVLFVNTKEFLVKWGTKNPINIPTQSLPGGIPIRAFGNFVMKIGDYVTLIDKVAGIKDSFSVDDVKERVNSSLDQLLMRWIVKEGKDMFNLQVNAHEISEGIRSDLDMEMKKIGLDISGFTVSSFTYPEEIQEKINKTASYSMVSDTDKYQKISMVDSMGKNGGNSSMSDAAGMVMGMNFANEMMKNNNNNNNSNTNVQEKNVDTKKCNNCKATINSSAKFCPECGSKNETDEIKVKYCTSCGTKILDGAKFCPECGNKA